MSRQARRGELVSHPTPIPRWARECLSLPCHVLGGRKFFLAEQHTALPEGSGTYCSAGGARSDAFSVISALTAKIHHTGPRCQHTPQEPERGDCSLRAQCSALIYYFDPITGPWEFREVSSCPERLGFFCGVLHGSCA